MKNLLLLLCTLILLLACDSEEQSNAVVDSGIAFSLKDGNSNDLLNPNHPNYYNKDSVKIYSSEGVLVDYSIGVTNDLTGNSNFYIYYINQMCNDQEMENMYCKRYWHWNASEVDTVEVFLKRFDDNMIASYKYKINGVEYEGENIHGKIVRLIK